MKASISFPVRSHHQKLKIEKLKIKLTFPMEMDQWVVEKVTEKYCCRLKEKYLFQKITLQKINQLDYEFICKRRQLMDVPLVQENFLFFLAHIGFIGIASIEEFEWMESQLLAKMVNDYSLQNEQKKLIKKYSSRKILLSTKEFNRLYQKLQITRNTIEQVHFQGDEANVWLDKIKDCDVILDYINDYYWSIGPITMLNKKVKHELDYFSNFYDNMKDSENIRAFADRQ